MTDNNENRSHEELGSVNHELINPRQETAKPNDALSRLAELVESSEDAITSTDLQGVFTSWNAAAERLYGLSKKDMIGTNVGALFIPGETDHLAGAFEAMMRGEVVAPPVEVIYTINDGPRPRDIAVTFSPLRDSGGNIIGVSCVGRDTTARRQVEDALEKANVALEEANDRLRALATQDGLTGLGNHRSFQERLDMEIQVANRDREPLALVMLDVDHFKQYNDTYGHPSGDNVLKRVASLIAGSLQEIDFAARYGGEEFALILPRTDRDAAVSTAERIRAAIASTSWQHRPITVSIGVCSLSENTADAGALIAYADIALYCSKKEGKNRVTYSSHTVSAPPMMDAKL